MRILIANKYYYSRGGDCIYTIELEKLLKEKNHEVAIFSMEHPLNLDSGFSSYFPREIDYNRKSLKTFFTAIFRPFGTGEVKKKFRELIKDFEPDIIHLNNIHTQLSPVIAQEAYRNNIPVVWTLHDGKLVCPAYLFLSNNLICEDCVSKSKISVVKKKCIKNSLMASILAWFEAIYWNREKLSVITGRLIAPSEFLKGKLILDGYRSSKISVLNNFISKSKYGTISSERKDQYCYIGRLSSEKGIETLLKAAEQFPEFKLIIIGTGPLEVDLKRKYENHHIEFTGYRKWDDIKDILASSGCMVIPSKCYENNPLTILESLCLGTPVIGSDTGGIPELIKPGVNGLLFNSGNVEDLQEKIKYLFDNSHVFNYPEIASDARKKYSSEAHYEKLNSIYNDLLHIKNH
ncbi:MAG TPA: glycosyl transferase family 1 [Bacteroidales bacterium]|nr:glycosyl transferase family 1 [Bacteroidales bacterium]